jgi:hypothetical protein
MEPLGCAIAILEQTLVMMKASQEKTEVNIETGQEPREAESKTDLEEMNTTDLEANRGHIRAAGHSY